jgi:hypothetical protein
MDTKRIKELEKQIADLKCQWPAHSVPPAMLQRLDDLEEELEILVEEMSAGKKDA